MIKQETVAIENVNLDDLVFTPNVLLVRYACDSGKHLGSSLLKCFIPNVYK